MDDRSEHAVFGYLTNPKAPLYRAVMLSFVAAKRRFVIHQRPEDVRDALGGGHDLDGVGDALRALEEWGNLRADPDTSRVTTVEDFHRARYLYQLTPAGEAAEEALAVYDQALGRRGSLQAVALADIAEQLRALVQHARQRAEGADVDAASVHLLLRSLVTRFTDLAGNAQAFMGALQRTLDLQDADAEAVRAYKDRLIDYLQRFVADLVAVGSEIAVSIADLERRGIDELLALAAWREAADAAPGDDDAAEDPRQAEFARGQVLWRERWAGFRGWFLSTPQHPSQARLLRAQALAAIPRLLHLVATINERRSGRSDRSADFRTLARWFAEAPDDAGAHRLWRVAFGLSSSRHLGIDADTLAEREQEPVPPSTPWWQAPQLRISPRLRQTGSYERRGKPTRVVDRSAQREHLAALAAVEAKQTAAARARLATGGPVRLSELGVLDAEAFGLFLRLLGDALAGLTPGRAEVRTTTSDGTLEIRLVADDAATEAAVVTPGGVLHGPDHLVHITDLAAVSGPSAGYDLRNSA